MGHAFHLLGLKHKGYAHGKAKQAAQGNATPFLNALSYFESFDDLPWHLFYREIDQLCPGSLFVNVVREPGEWLVSYRAHRETQRTGIVSPEMANLHAMAYPDEYQNLSPGQLVAAYRKRNREVREYFRGRAGQYLELPFDMLGDAMWWTLCSFLGRDYPEKHFPQANTRSQREAGA